MATLDSATEWRRLSELYARMADGELLALARKQSELTEVAQGALANEMTFRKLKPQPEAPAGPPKPARELDPAYEEERKLVLIRTVWSVADTLQMQQLLDRAGIPFFMGPEMATGVDAVTSNFAAGVDVKIMSIGVPWAWQALQYYEPKNEPASEQQPEPHEIPVRCPRCHSTEVVFEDLIGEEPMTEETQHNNSNGLVIRVGIGGRMMGLFEKNLEPRRARRKIKIPTLSQKTRQGWGTLQG